MGPDIGDISSPAHEGHRTEPRAERPARHPAGRREASITYLRRRLTALAVLAVPFLIWWSLASPGETDRDPLLRDVDAVVVLVEPGDTLWEIARRLRPEGDHRSLVDKLSRSVTESTLRVGEEIRIPAKFLE